MYKTGKAFTLVELIVVITILAILGTIAFLSFQGYSQSARDSTRITDLGNIEISLELFALQSGYYPEPTGSVDITFSGSQVWGQGTMGEDTINILQKLSKKPVDPLTSSDYTYSRLNNKREYELGSIHEAEISGNIYNSSYAANKTATAYTTGNYNKVLAKVQTGVTTYVLALPSIIDSTLSSTKLEDIMVNKSLVYKHYNNVPSSYSQAGYSMTGSNIKLVNNSNYVVYGGDEQDLVDPNDSSYRNTMVMNLRGAYTGTDLEIKSEIQTIMNADDTNISGLELLSATLIDNGFGTQVVNSLLNKENNTQRYFTTFDGIDDYVEIPTVTLSGDFEIEFSYAGTAGEYLPFLTADDLSRVARIDTGGTVRGYAGSMYVTSSTVINDGKLHKIKIIRNGSNLLLYVDGIEEDNITNPLVLGNTVVDFLMKRGSNYTQGIIGDVKITDNGNLVRSYKLDSYLNSSNVFIDEQTTLGSELWTHGTISTTGASGGFVELRTVPTQIGKTYYITYNIDSFDAGIISPYSGVTTLSNSNTGSYSAVITASDTKIGFIILYNPTTVTISNISVKEASGYSRAYNIEEDSSELFTQGSDGWYGKELWDHSLSNVAGLGEITSNGARFDLDGAEVAVYRQPNILELGYIYKFSFNIYNYLSGDVAENSSGFRGVGVNQNGFFKGVTLPATTTSGNLSRLSGICHYNISNMSWKRFLENME